MAMTLDKIVPWGRSLAEYQRMFALTAEDCAGHILGCGDGPASFNAEMTALGYSVISIDPIYTYRAAEIRQRVRETHATIVEKVALTPQDYLWAEFRDPNALGAHRLATMEHFLRDYEAGVAAGRYQPQALPTLDFPDQHFTLALSSHFLLLYTEQLSLEFHCAAVKELCRVACEVRIFPLLDLACQRSAHVEPLQRYLQELGYRAQIEAVPYEFQRGGNQMLRVVRVKG
ncbi:MAG TPA: hypothetical protein P5121_37745 [Caldilineaceae bacterium]|nr:hypothetical protein [Caldilineaceae bacterium]